MFLSFIVPVYNTEKYLAECLDSLLTQDIPYDDYEIICVNDGSTDNSREILQVYSEKYNNIVIVDKENGGLPSARNAGYPYVHGDYIWFVDSDDFIQQNILGMLKVTIEEYPYDRLNFGTYTFYEALTGAEIEAAHDGKLISNTYLYNIVVWNNIFRFDFLKSNNIYFRYPDVKHSEDGIFMFETSISEPQEKILDAVGYYYRRRPSSLTTSKSLHSHEMRVVSYRAVSKILLRYYQKELGDPQFLADLLMSNIWLLMYSVAFLPLKTSISIVNQLKADGIYPFIRPVACTIKKSYQTSRTDLVGKVFDKIYINMHRPWGFWSMFVFQRLVSIKSKLIG